MCPAPALSSRTDHIFQDPSVGLFFLAGRALSLCGTLDAAVWADRVVKDVAQDDTRPRLALRQAVVELWRNLPHLRQIGPGDIWEVVVLIVVAHVVTKDVEPSIV